jgi:putative ABC transport system substrate-binding protein
VKKSIHSLILVVLLVALVVSACGGDDDKKSDNDKSYTIGVLIQAPSLERVVEGFKAGLANLGYTEDTNVVYVSDGPTGTIEALSPAAEDLKSKKLDLLFTVGTPPTQVAKDVFTGTDVPILFAPVFNPVELGFVESFPNPGGQLTGIQSTNSVAKALEWLLEIVPDVKRIYVPHNPEDASGVQTLQVLTDTSKTLGVELVVSEGTTQEELDAVTRNIPDDVDAVFVLRTGSIGARISNIIQAANELGIPAACSDIGPLLEAGVMVGYGPGYHEMGEQAARMADQLLKGTDPATLPVEEAETFLGISLQAAETIGLEVPDSALRQAKQVVRPAAQ